MGGGDGVAGSGMVGGNNVEVGGGVRVGGGGVGVGNAGVGAEVVVGACVMIGGGGVCVGDPPNPQAATRQSTISRAYTPLFTWQSLLKAGKSFFPIRFLNRD
jgi:hypothetical protein